MSGVGALGLVLVVAGFGTFWTAIGSGLVATATGWMIGTLLRPRVASRPRVQCPPRL